MYPLQVTLGLFMVLYRFRWVYDPAYKQGNPLGIDYRTGEVLYRRVAWGWFNPHHHTRLAGKLMECGYWPWLATPVALVELAAGVCLILNTWVWWSALGLFVILLFAWIATGTGKVDRQGPVDLVDRLSCSLWCPEPLYMVMCLVIMGGR